MWRANMDLQYILNTCVCASYCAGYITKVQHSMSELLRKAAKEVQSTNSNVKEQLRFVASKFLNATETGAPEAVYVCLQILLKRSSRATIFINTNRLENRVYLLESRSELEKIKDKDENVMNEDLISKYIKRPSELENLSLAEFAADYTYQSGGKKYEAKSKLWPDGFLLEMDDNDETDELLGINNENPNSKKVTKNYHKRQISRIIRTCYFDKNTHKEDHYREKIMLSTSWRDENTLMNNSVSYGERYDELKEKFSHIVFFSTLYRRSGCC